jgi:hypothetical protein
MLSNLVYPLALLKNLISATQAVLPFFTSLSPSHTVNVKKCEVAYRYFTRILPVSYLTFLFNALIIIARVA